MNTTETKAMTKKELKNYYSVSYKTLKKWLDPFKEEIGEVRGSRYTPKQVSIIFEKLG